MAEFGFPRSFSIDKNWLDISKKYWIRRTIFTIFEPLYFVKQTQFFKARHSFLQISKLYLPKTRVTWKTLARNPKAASIEIVSHEGADFWGCSLLEAAAAAKSVLNVLDLFLRILAGMGISFWSMAPVEQAELEGISFKDCLSLDFSRIDNRDLITHSRVGAW